MVLAQTDLDGSFTATNVPPGDYYAFAFAPGYLQPMVIVQAAIDNGADLKKSIPGIPITHVTADRSVKVDLVIDRGAAISGKVLWDDGTPATHIIVMVTSTKTKSRDPSQELPMLQMGSAISGANAPLVTDDLGNFRIAGLAPGDYLVKASLQTHLQLTMQDGLFKRESIIELPLTVFAPAAFHPADAKPITLHSGEDREGEDITIRLAGLHSVSGQIASLEDHHGINSAIIWIKDPHDKDFIRTAHIDPHGNFTIEFIPPGTYDLLVNDAADTEPSTKKISTGSGFLIDRSDRILRRYEDSKHTIIVSDNDITGQNIELAPAKTPKKDLDPNDPIKN
jgi:hypothetical protein